MENVLEIRNLTKTYKDFVLDNLNLCLPKGHIMGFVGENGAGKSTTIKLILNIIHRDQGEIKVFGKDNLEYEQQIKQNIGVVLDESNFPESLNGKNINSIMKRIYRNWDEKLYLHYFKKFSLPTDKEIKTFSRGMKMKLSIAVALSHNAKLLILDEPTSGLDPIVRDEILDIFLDFIQNDENSIFISTHITSDIEKIADYIAFIHSGKLILAEQKDVLQDTYGVIRCKTSEFESLDKTYVKGYRKSNFGVEALVKKPNLKTQLPIEPASIEDIMLFTIRGAKQ
ncbi:MAG: ABC transporter ATP-binding protein [Firmicutes bacterium]|nr:ABC transporter ATP-binding protein [Bacillota bacterium]